MSSPDDFARLVDLSEDLERWHLRRHTHRRDIRAEVAVSKDAQKDKEVEAATASASCLSKRQPELLGQTVVVIGGSSGIGLETARRTHSEGANVVLTGRDPERLQQAGNEVDALCTAAFDATDPDQLEQFFQDLPHPIDHIMVTAGGSYYAPLAEMDFAKVRRSLDEHLLLALQVARKGVATVRPGGTLVFMTGTRARRPERRPRDCLHSFRCTPGSHGKLGARTGASPSQPHRRRLRRHAPIRVPARRRPQTAAQPATHRASHPAGRRTCGRRRPRRAPHGELGPDGSDLRRRRWRAARLRSMNEGFPLGLNEMWARLDLGLTRVWSPEFGLGGAHDGVSHHR